MSVVARLLLVCLTACGRLGFSSIDGATSDATTTNPRVSLGLVSFYRFDAGEGDIVRDLSGAAPVQDLVIAPNSEVMWTPTGLRVWGANSQVATAGAADKILAASLASKALTVEAWVTPARLDAMAPIGPDRIVSMSMNIDERNFTLGQGPWGFGALDAFSLRARTDQSDSNGNPGIDSLPGTTALQRFHLVATMVLPGDLVLYIDGVEVAREGRTGDFSNWEP